MEQVPTFLEHAEFVMSLREADGVRGLERELSRFNVHIATAAFAGKSIGDVTSRDLRDWGRDMLAKPALGPGEPRTLDYQTVKRTWSLVSAVFGDAVERDLVPTNPCVGVRIKKRADARDAQEKWAYLTTDEQALYRSCRAIPIEDKLITAFAWGSGVRQSEQYSLELPDLVVTGQDPHLVVRFSARSRDGKKQPPKSSKIRRVPLLPPTLAVAKTWLDILPTYAPENPEGLVFPTRSGKIRQQGKPLGTHRRFKDHMVAAGIKLRPHLCWHSLRHTFASNLITGAYGRMWRLEEIQQVLGHASITMTQRYAHLGEDAIKRAARETAEAMRRAS